MRSFIVCVIVLFTPLFLVAQEETLFSQEDDVDGFGGPAFKLTTLNGQTALLAGGRGGWIFDHSLIIGGGAYGLITEVDPPAGVLPDQGPLNIDFSMFGLEVEYVPRPTELFHYTVYAFVGGGAIRFMKDFGGTGDGEAQVEETDLAFVVEPALNVELNVATWWRVTAGVSYRISTGVTQIGLDNGDFTGPVGSVVLKFGSF